MPYAYDPTPLIKGEIDASLDFTTNVPFTIKQAGEEAVSFLLYDFGFTIYNDTVVVTEDTLEGQAQGARRLARGQPQGLGREPRRTRRSIRRNSPTPGSRAPAARSRTRSTSTPPRSR